MRSIRIGKAYRRCRISPVPRFAQKGSSLLVGWWELPASAAERGTLLDKKLADSRSVGWDGGLIKVQVAAPRAAPLLAAKQAAAPSHTDTHTGSRTHRGFARIGTAMSMDLADCPRGQTGWLQDGMDTAIRHMVESILLPPRFLRHGGSRSCPEQPVRSAYAGSHSLDTSDRLARLPAAELGIG